MLSELLPSIGDVWIKNMKLNYSNMAAIRKHVGYCPQANSYYDFLTVREHIEFILAIKNIEQNCCESLLELKMKRVNLKKYEDYEAVTLSGGNQRKLN